MTPGCMFQVAEMHVGRARAEVVGTHNYASRLEDAGCMFQVAEMPIGQARAQVVGTHNHASRLPVAVRMMWTRFANLT